MNFKIKYLVSILKYRLYTKTKTTIVPIVNILNKYF